MPVLENPKHELFAQRVAAGEPSSRAYAALYDGDTEVGHDRGSASRLRSNAIVAARIEELQREAAEGTVSTIGQLRRLCLDIMHADLADAYDENENLLPVTDMPLHLRRALQGVEVEEIGIEGVKVGNTKKLKLADKKAAAELLAKLDGRLTQKVEHSGKVTLEDLVTSSLTPPPPKEA